jgi:hypothetical protein
LQDNFRRQLLLVSGFSKHEVDNFDLPSLNDDELQVMVRKKLLGVNVSENGRQKMVSIDDANNYLERGWEYVDKLSNNRVVVKRVR